MPIRCASVGYSRSQGAKGFSSPLLRPWRRLGAGKQGSSRRLYRAGPSLQSPWHRRRLSQLSPLPRRHASGAASATLPGLSPGPTRTFINMGAATTSFSSAAIPPAATYAPLLATDESYLKAEGLSLQAIKGAMPVSGVFIIPPGPIFDVAFGKDPKARKQASPISHVQEDLPAFLVLFGDSDLPSCDRPGAEAFCKASAGEQGMPSGIVRDPPPQSPVHPVERPPRHRSGHASHAELHDGSGDAGPFRTTGAGGH